MPRIVPSAWKREAARGGEGLERALARKTFRGFRRGTRTGAGAASSASSARRVAPFGGDARAASGRLAAVRPDDLAGFAGGRSCRSAARSRASARCPWRVHRRRPNAAARTFRTASWTPASSTRCASRTARVRRGKPPTTGGAKPKPGATRRRRTRVLPHCPGHHRSAASVSSAPPVGVPRRRRARRRRTRSFTRPASGAGVADALAATLRLSRAKKSYSGTNDAL